MSDAKAPAGGEDTGGLRRSLGLPSLLFFGLGTILGAGVYSVIGAAAGVAGAGLWQSFLLASLIALPTALSYGELATTYAEPSAEYSYLRHAMPRRHLPAFLVGSLMAASCAATSATVAIAFAGYASSLLPGLGAWVAAVLLLVAMGVAIVGIRESASMTVVFTLVEAGGLAFIVYLGAKSETFGAALREPPTLAVLQGSSLVFFSFLGFENIANLAAEARKPERSLAPAILGSLALATLLYVLVALAVVALMPPDALARSTAPLADAASAGLSGSATWLGAVALFATANTALASLVCGSRILFGIAQGGDLPRGLAKVLPGRRTPWVATLVLAAAAGALLPLGNVAVVSGVSSFVSLLAFAAVNVAVVMLRFRDAEAKRPFRVPLTVAKVPVPAALGAVLSLALATRIEALAIFVGLGFTAFVAGLWFFVRRLRSSAPG